MWQNGPKNRGKNFFFQKFDFKWKYFFTLMMDDGRKWVFGPSQMLIPPIMAQNGPKMAPKSPTLLNKVKIYNNKQLFWHNYESCQIWYEEDMKNFRTKSQKTKLANVAKWTKNPKVKEILEVTYFQHCWKSWNLEWTEV